MTRVAAIQMISGADLEINLQQAEKLIVEAVAAGAKLVVLPEVFALFDSKKQREIAEQEASSTPRILPWLSQQATQHSIWIVAGTIPLLVDGEAHRVAAASLVFDDKGQQVARYDKIHLFDVNVADGQGSYRESDSFIAGDQPLTLDTPFGRLGVAVCYDIRFPELFRAMLDEGMEILAIPAAFTLITGEAHWLPLLKARAIENQIYVIGANQGGEHTPKRKTSGGSVIIDAWGNVLVEAARGEAMICAEIDLTALHTMRKNMPINQHRRFDVVKR
jgi:predicted amidohydrolase